MCEMKSKTITTHSCKCQHQHTGENTVCEQGVTISVDSDDPLSLHIIKLFSPDSVSDYRCDQCQALTTLDSPAITQRFLLSLPRFLRVNITSPLTAQRLPEDSHKQGPLREFERLNLSQLTPQLQPTQGLYVLRAAIMYSQRHHWTYVHGSPSIHVSDELSRIATPGDLQNVALCARILIYEQDARSEEGTNTTLELRNSASKMAAETAVCKPAPLSPAAAPAQLVAARQQGQFKRHNKRLARRQVDPSTGRAQAASMSARQSNRRDMPTAVVSAKHTKLRQCTLGDYLQPAMSAPCPSRKNTQAPPWR